MVRNFSRWMDQHQVCPAELNDAAIDRYLTTLAQSPKPPSGDRKKEIAGALHALWFAKSPSALHFQRLHQAARRSYR